MIEGGEDFGFAAEASEAISVDGDGSGKNFEGDFAAEFAVAGAVHFAHSADTEERGYFVGTNFGSGGQRHLSGEL